MKILIYIIISIQLFNLLNANSNNETNVIKNHQFLNRHVLLNQINNPKNFILITVIPLSVGLTIVCLLAILMFGSRKGSEKRLQKTQAHELVQYYSVKNAFNNLRIRLNYYRDV
jgi:hypothetical protein